MASSSSEEQKQEESQSESQPQSQPQSQAVKECLHKTKVIEFLGRTTPIVLQNDNGPCPLLAICNVLLLRNNLNLSPDISEVSQEKLLSLVADRLIDSNSNINNKDEGYVENQQQNIADAIDLLPRLATGIDVNIKFRRIDDFEFTRECAIFDLLDIPLYHGWIVDPQDFDTANAIGSKSYNALMGDLVALETRNMDREHKNNNEEDCVDFAAATTAALGVPSPCLSKARSFDDSPDSTSDDQKLRKGDIEEEAELLRALKLSQAEIPSSVGDPLASNINEGPVSVNLDESTHPKEVHPPGSLKTSDKHAVEDNNFYQTDLCISDDSSASMNEVRTLCTDVVEKSSIDTTVQIENAVSLSTERDTLSVDENKGYDTKEVSLVSAKNDDLDSSSSQMQPIDACETLTSSVDDSEPIYEGEECIIDSGTTVFEDREPVYEGEMVLAKQTDKSTLDARSKDVITQREGELIRNFLKNSASQLTFYGLFCLQDGLKERELCVFFRNNHFSTMFKFNGELYLLATDQGYITQPDLVWEKLNEVNGDTLFMTGNFKEFKVENHSNETWNENNALASTADYLASIDSAAQAGLDMNSDLQLAIALQQQEFDQQPQRQNAQQPSINNSRLVTGPQGPRRNSNTTSSSRPEAKSKEKCIVM
nr:ubiquitin carboxyl-terminal hydrolase MINDY-1 isoform X6 [Ziziphus jujuba var. spinosa]